MTSTPQVGPFISQKRLTSVFNTLVLSGRLLQKLDQDLEAINRSMAAMGHDIEQRHVDRLARARLNRAIVHEVDALLRTAIPSNIAYEDDLREAILQDEIPMDRAPVYPQSASATLSEATRIRVPLSMASVLSGMNSHEDSNRILIGTPNDSNIWLTHNAAIGVANLIKSLAEHKIRLEDSTRRIKAMGHFLSDHPEEVRDHNALKGIVSDLEGRIHSLYGHLKSLPDAQIDKELSEAGYDARSPEGIVWAWSRGFAPSQSIEMEFAAGTVIDIVSGYDPEARKNEWALGGAITDAQRDAHVWIGVKAPGKSACELLRQDGRILEQFHEILKPPAPANDGPSF